MAESEIQLAQDILRCTYCETEVATDYCQSCADNLCLKCKSFHLKSNVPDGHHIVPIVQKRKEVIVMCPNHPSKKYEACCEKCEVPVCVQCIVEDHSSHKLIQKSHMYDKIKYLMSKALKNIKISNQQIKLIQVKSDKQNMKVSYEYIRDEMKKKADQVKKRVDDILEWMINDSIDHENRTTAELSSYEELMEGFLQEISGEVKSYQKKIQSSHPTDLILLYKTICDFLTSVNSKTLKVQPPVFEEGKLEVNIDLFGNFAPSIIRCVTDHEEVRADTCDEFQTDMDVDIPLLTKDQITIDENLEGL